MSILSISDANITNNNNPATNRFSNKAHENQLEIDSIDDTMPFEVCTQQPKED